MNDRKTESEISLTLRWMFVLMHTDEIGDCLIWNGSARDNRYPCFRKKDGKQVSARREVLELEGKALERGQRVDSTCGDTKCVNPLHLFPSSHADVGRKAAKRGAFSGVARAAKIAATKRAKGAKITMDDARAIRMSGETMQQLASKYGISRSTVHRIMNGKAWRDFANPYRDLMRVAA